LVAGIDGEGDHRAFRYSDESQLDDEVQKCIAWAVNWLTARADAVYYTGTAGFDNDELFKGAEQDLAIYRLLPRLKIRRVLGLHAPYDQEASDRFESLIDVEIPAHVEAAIAPFLTSDLTPDDDRYAYPAMVATTAVDRSEILDWPSQLQDALDGSTGLIGTLS
jgi:hypothetical protein